MSKEFEELNNLNYEDVVFMHKDYWNEIQKKLKALDIIKEKKVDAAIFFEKSNSVRHRKKLTQEEYDLLKEVLL